MDDELPLTEEVNPSTQDLDLLPTAELLHRINDEDRRAAWAVEREIAVIATAVDAVAERLRRGGRLHYFGAGTSGRIAAMDAAEMEPTFGAGKLVHAHLAGGVQALAKAVEGAEDDAAAGLAQVRAAGIGPNDAVVGLSAGGNARFVIGACQAAREAGALTVCITNNPQGPLAQAVQIPVVLRTGAEVIAGSTRMKAGAAQKMALTALSTAVMVKLGKVYGNLMVELAANNAKLRDRAHRLVVRLAGVSAETAATTLAAAGYRVKNAVVMLRRRCDADEADELLARAGGVLRAVLESTQAAGQTGRSPR